MQILIATPDDAATFARLNRHVHQLHLDNEPAFFRKPSHEEATDAFRRLLGKENAFAFLAVEADEAVGYVVAFVQERDAHAFCPARRFLFIEQISVEPSWQGNGIGRALMDAALHLADQKGIANIEVGTWAFNDQAQAFFDAIGFTPKTLNYQMTRGGA